MLSGSGLYYIGWDWANSKGKLNLLQVSRDTTGLSAQLLLTPAQTPSSFTDAKISASQASSNTDHLIVAMSYDSYYIDFFQVQLLKPAYSVSSQTRFGYTQLNTVCLGVNSASDGKSYALIYTNSNTPTLLHLNLAGSSYKTRAGSASTTTLHSEQALFMAGQSEYYMSALFQPTGYSNYAGQVFTSNASRRRTTLLASSWSADVSISLSSICSSGCVTATASGSLPAETTNRIENFASLHRNETWLSKEFLN